MDSLIRCVGILFTIYLAPNPSPQNYVGSGFFFQYKDSYYIAICRHCIDNFDLPGFELKLNSALKSDSLNKNIPIRFSKKEFIFNPKDTDSTTYDIAIAQVKQPRNVIEKYGLSPIELPSFQSLPKLYLGDSLIVIGYPQSQFDKRVSNGDTISLKPYIVKGEFLYGLPKSNIKVGGSKRLLQSQFFVKVESSDDLSGISGGLVLLVRENKYYPIGIVTSTANGIYMDKNINSIGFTPISKIYETINAL